MLDLATLYCLAIGTLLVSAGLLMWERAGRTHRRRELAVWSLGWTTLALGCGVAMLRDRLPGITGWAAGNLVMVTGYLLVLDGIARLGGRHYRGTAATVLLLLAGGWIVAGARGHAAFWQYAAGAPIAIASLLAAFELRRNRPLGGLRSRPVAVLLSGGHGLFYTARVLILPLAVARWGGDLVALASRVTMYEGVLYSVAMPMTLLSLVREEAQQQLLAAARSDFLTGLANRHGFFEEGAQVLRQRSGAPVTLLAFDLDHFKSINDAHGHAGGDTVLRSFAQVVRDLSPPRATLARLGGEEFVALLPGTDRDAAKVIGERIAQRFAAMHRHGGEGIRSGVTVSATVSIGLARLGLDGDDLDALLGAADRALYVAKSLGRNRLVAASPLFDGVGELPGPTPPTAAPRQVA